MIQKHMYSYMYVYIYMYYDLDPSLYARRENSDVIDI